MGAYSLSVDRSDLLGNQNRASGMDAGCDVCRLDAYLHQLVSPESFNNDIRETFKKRAFPIAFCVLFDIGVCLWLVYAGWVFTGLMWLSTIATDIIFHNMIPALLERGDEKKTEKEGVTTLTA